MIDIKFISNLIAEDKVGVWESKDFKLKEIIDEEGKGNNWKSVLGNQFENKYGIYFIYSGEGELFYIGECGYRKNDKEGILTRLGQHFTECNSGGTFRDNYLDAENSSFKAYLVEAKKFHVKTYLTDSSPYMIKAIEQLLIDFFKPKYNKYKEPSN